MLKKNIMYVVIIYMYSSFNYIIPGPIHGEDNIDECMQLIKQYPDFFAGITRRCKPDAAYPSGLVIDLKRSIFDKFSICLTETSDSTQTTSYPLVSYSFACLSGLYLGKEMQDTEAERLQQQQLKKFAQHVECPVSFGPELTKLLQINNYNQELSEYDLKKMSPKQRKIKFIHDLFKRTNSKK